MPNRAKRFYSRNSNEIMQHSFPLSAISLAFSFAFVRVNDIDKTLCDTHEKHAHNLMAHNGHNINVNGVAIENDSHRTNTVIFFFLQLDIILVSTWCAHCYCSIHLRVFVSLCKSLGVEWNAFQENEFVVGIKWMRDWAKEKEQVKN